MAPNHTEAATRKPFFNGRLTKTVLMGLPNGLILLSNVCSCDPMTPLMETILGPMNTREELWREMRLRQVDGRTFLGFLNVEGLQLLKDEQLKALNSPGASSRVMPLDS
jgi:hypothetical protein